MSSFIVDTSEKKRQKDCTFFPLDDNSVFNYTEEDDDDAFNEDGSFIGEYSDPNRRKGSYESLDIPRFKHTAI